ncbi:MAG: shikimate kinase, partial [Acidimicrobiales bacterium]
MPRPNHSNPITKRVFLVGMMGAGKTTVGHALAARMGWTFLDSDAEVEAATGMTVPQIFTRQGEAAFRAEESAVLMQACSRSDPVVVAVAGGAVLDATNRQAMADSGQVVWLRADIGTLARRVGDGQGRPLLGEDPAAALAELERWRRPLYQELAKVVVDVDRHSPEDLVDVIVGSLELGGSAGDTDDTGANDTGTNDPGANDTGDGLISIPVELEHRGYSVLVGPGAITRLAGIVAATVPGARRAAVVTQAGVGVKISSGLPEDFFDVKDGEGAKSLATVEQLCRGFAQVGLARCDVV